MPTMRASDRNWDRLKKWADPFSDRPDDALGKVLAAAERWARLPPSIQQELLAAYQPDPEASPQLQSSATHLAPPPQPRQRGELLPQKEFRPYLMRAVHELGPAASKQQVCLRVYEHVKNRLSEADHAPVKTGEPRWLNAICWERSVLVKEGLFSSTSPRGVWELSERGRKQMDEGS